MQAFCNVCALQRAHMTYSETLRYCRCAVSIIIPLAFIQHICGSKIPRRESFAIRFKLISVSGLLLSHVYTLRGIMQYSQYNTVKGRATQDNPFHCCSAFIHKLKQSIHLFWFLGYKVAPCFSVYSILHSPWKMMASQKRTPVIWNDRRLYHFYSVLR